jgi:hypothetical protein
MSILKSINNWLSGKKTVKRKIKQYRRDGRTVKAHQRTMTVNNGRQKGFLPLGNPEIYDPYRPQDYKPQQQQRKTHADANRMKAPPAPTHYKHQQPGERWQPTKEQVLKSKLYVASLAQEYADKRTSGYQAGERQYWLQSRNATLGTARRYAQLNGILDLFKALTGLE